MAAKKNPFAKMAAAKGKKAPAKGKMPMAFGKKKAC